MPMVQNYSYRDYNAPGQVWTVLQDRRGVIYMGASAGEVLEFDGVTWRKIFVPSTAVRSLAMDEQGTIFVGTGGNLGYLTPDATGKLHYVTLNDKIPAEDRNFTDVWQVLPTAQGVFFRTYERLFRWDGKSMHVFRPAPGSRFQALSAVRGVVYTDQQGIGLQTIDGDALHNAPGGEAYRESGKLFLYPWDDTHMIVSEREGLLTLYDGHKVTPFPTQADAYLKLHKTYTSLLLRNGSLCLTTLSGGAVIIGHDGQLLQTLDKAAGLLDSDTLTAYQDRDGAVWIGMGPGVSRVDINSPISIYSREGLLDVIRYKGTLYAASGGGPGAVDRIVFDPLTGLPSEKPLHGPSQGWQFIDFKDPAHPDAEQLLVATSMGVMRMEGDSLVPVIPALNSLQEQTYNITQSKKDPMRILIGHSDGVGSIRWNGQAWVDEGRLPQLVYAGRNVVEDPNGTVWVSGDNGKILRVEVAPTGMRDSKAEVISEGLPDTATDAEYVAGSIFVLSDRSKHEYRWDAGAHSFVVDDRFALPVDAPDASYGLIPNPDGTFFSGTNSSDTLRLGLFRQAADGTWKVDEKTYLPLTQFHDFNLHIWPGGIVWASGGENVVAFNPHASSAGAAPFQTLVREVSAGSRTLFGGAAVAGNEALPRLPPGTDALTFQFAAPHFNNAAATAYQYLLEGADRDWSTWSKTKEANYSGLGPGHYRFRVRSRASDGGLGSEADFAFTILPPWYRSTLAYVLYGLLFLLITFAIWRAIIRYERAKAQRRTAELVAQAKALEATVTERTQEIRAQAEKISAQKESIELLSDIGREITASLDLNTILFKLYERVNQIVDAGIFGVGLYRPEQRLIEYTLAIENGKRYAPYTRSTDDKSQFAVWCIERRQPILLNDVEKEYSKYIAVYEHGTRVLEDGSEAQPPASMIYLPLIAQDRVLGVLSIQSFRKNAYTEQHLSLLENLAAYTTIALDNANAYGVINQRAAELITINRITQALASQLEREQLIQFFGDQVRDVFHAPIAYVAILDRPSMMLHFPYTWGEEAPSRPFGTGLTSQIIRTGQPLLINEDMDANRAKLGVEQIGRTTASYLGVPISSGGQTIGVISVQSTDQEGRFTESDQRLLSTIASAVGVAFYNAKLFDEARQARAAAEEADAAKSSFLSTVSHELRTPLTSVLGFAKIIRRRLEERLFPLIAEDDRKVQQAKKQVIENLDVVVSEGERLTKLIDDVLDLAKIEAGKFTWNMTTVFVPDVIERATAATASLFEAKRLKLIRDMEPELPPITGDQDRLIQVVINLISNAVKFTDAGSVRCAARMGDGELVVSVTDSGIGIAPVDQPKVFEKFKQVGDTLTDKPKGTGLGLPICREIVEYHGGRIWVESAPGEGSTFSFTLPLAAEVSADGAVAEAALSGYRFAGGAAAGEGLHAVAKQVGAGGGRRSEYPVAAAAGADGSGLRGASGGGWAQGAGADSRRDAGAGDSGCDDAGDERLRRSRGTEERPGDDGYSDHHSVDRGG